MATSRGIENRTERENIVDRRGFLSLTGAAACLVASGVLTGIAFADGALTITNKTIDGQVMVEARMGGGIDDAVLAARQPLKKGESLNLDSTNLQYYWRRELAPGSEDGKWTDWQRVDTRNGDQHVSF